MNCKQKSSSFVPIIFHNFSGYDCHLLIEQPLPQAFKRGYEPKISPKSLENYVNVQVGCSYRFLSSSLDKLVKSINSFSVMQENGLDDELFNMKLAYPFEYFMQTGNLGNFDKPLNLTKEVF